MSDELCTLHGSFTSRSAARARASGVAGSEIIRRYQDGRLRFIVAARCRAWSRPRKKFSSARAAWADIAEKTGTRARQVRPDHTKKKWRWIEKK